MSENLCFSLPRCVLDRQRFFVEDKYFQNGGPVLIQFGGEGPADDVWLREGQIATYYGRDLGARLILIEHRFYGDSRPTE